MEKMRVTPCGVQVCDLIDPKAAKEVKIYSCPALRLTPITLYSSDGQNNLREVDCQIVDDYIYSDCWQMRDAGKCPAMQA